MKSFHTSFLTHLAKEHPDKIEEYFNKHDAISTYAGIIEFMVSREKNKQDQILSYISSINKTPFPNTFNNLKPSECLDILLKCEMQAGQYYKATRKSKIKDRYFEQKNSFNK